MLVVMFQELSDLIFRTSEGAFFFIMFLTIIINLSGVFLTKRLVNTEEVERKQRQIKALEADKEKIKP